MTTTTTTKKQDWNNQHFFAWDGVKAKYPIDDLCLCGKRRDARKNKNYPLHFPETTPYTHRVTPPTDTTKEKWEREFEHWLAEEAGEPEHLVMLMQSVCIDPGKLKSFIHHSLIQQAREEMIEKARKLAKKGWADPYGKHHYGVLTLSDLLTKEER